MEMSTSSDPTRPALAMELVTLIVGFAQDLEDDKPIQLPSSESPSATLARVRRLLEKGLVSKAWHDAIMAPSVWTTFLNIGMSEKQFLNVLRRVKHLPAGIWFSDRPLAEGDGHARSPTPPTISPQVVIAVGERFTRATSLVFHLSRVKDIRKRRDLLGLLEHLKKPAPLLRTCALLAPHRDPFDLVTAVNPEEVFGGVRPLIRSLFLVNTFMSPRSFCCSNLVSLTLGGSSFRSLTRVLNQWASEIGNPNVPALKHLIITSFQVYPHPVDIPFPVFTIPRTVERLAIHGSMVVCRFICKQMLFPKTTHVTIFALTHPVSSHLAIFKDLLSVFERLWGTEPVTNIFLSICGESLGLGVCNALRPVSIIFEPGRTSDRDDRYLRLIARTLTRLRDPAPGVLLGGTITDKTRLSIKLEVLERDLQDADLPGCSLADTFHMLFCEPFQVRNLLIDQYDVVGDDGSKSTQRTDALRLFGRHENDGAGSEFLFPNLQCIHVGRGRDGVTPGLHEAIIAYAKERSLVVEAM
ncbi:hypothetical protein FA13DRAFT_1718560 [Coprinellus micaceus]|uniref:Uncharacterized protein n=1 Tax=Coprinellus micaceus TaxID=71717 RepID=A0A4Y7SDB2_COPMI|nr:hypothetical protein FA13DRAFT_1718560 [Coprinellus micaceus]